jgi:hypothetical protein
LRRRDIVVEEPERVTISSIVRRDGKFSTQSRPDGAVVTPRGDQRPMNHNNLQYVLQKCTSYFNTSFSEKAMKKKNH